jgi:hypothetical protein
MAEVSSVRRASRLTSRFVFCLAVPWALYTFGAKDDYNLVPC